MFMHQIISNQKTRKPTENHAGHVENREDREIRAPVAVRAKEDEQPHARPGEGHRHERARRHARLEVDLRAGCIFFAGGGDLRGG